MKLVELDVLKFLDVVDSNSPAPGGGSVSALASSLGASLARMVAHLSFGKKNYEALADDVKAKFVANFDELLKIKNELNDLIDRDSEAYNTVMAAYKLPKETDEEKHIRKEEIQRTTKRAALVPFEIGVLAASLLPLAETVIVKGNTNAITDGAIAVINARAAVKSAFLNVRINLGSIQDQEFVDAMNVRMSDIEATLDEEEKRLLGLVQL